MAEYPSKSKIAELHSRVYPLAIKKPSTSSNKNRSQHLNRRYSQDSSMPNFVTDFLDEDNSPKYDCQSRIKIPKYERTTQRTAGNSCVQIDLHPPVCLDIPRISYKDYLHKPARSEVNEQLYFSNTFYTSPRSKIIVYAKEKINPVKIPKFKPVIMKKYKKPVKKMITLRPSRIDDINAKIKKMHEYVNDPIL